MEQVTILSTVVPQPGVPKTLYKSLKCPNLDRMRLQHHLMGSIAWGMLRCPADYLGLRMIFNSIRYYFRKTSNYNLDELSNTRGRNK